MSIKKLNQKIDCKSQVDVFIGSAFLGVNPEIVDTIGVYSEHYKAQVIHLGPIATDDEVKMYRYRLHKLATWDKHLKEMAESVGLEAEESIAIVDAAYEQLLEKGSKNIRNVNWDDLSEDGLGEDDIKHLSLLLQSKISAEKARVEMGRLKAAQRNRIDTILAALPNTKFVFAEDGVVDFVGTVIDLDDRYLGNEIKHRHIHAISMLANGPKVSHPPITARTIAALGSRKSTVMAHPVSMATSRNAEGLNNARNYFTTGMLYIPESPRSTKDIHKGKHLPGAVVCVHSDDGSFFADCLIVECGDKKPFIGQDGLIFSVGGGVQEADSQVVWNDLHAPYEHHGVVNAGIHAAKSMRTVAITLNGDVIEMEASNRHAIGQPQHLENKRIYHDLMAGKALTDKIADQTGVANLTWVLGNHEEWITQKVAKHPELIHLLDWPTLERQWFPRWKIIKREAGGNTVHSFGNLHHRHGDEESLEAAIEALGNTQNGHWHWFFRIGQSGKLGAACRLGPGYVGNNLTAWQSQFMTNTIHKGLTQSTYHTVLHDDKTKTSRFTFRNKIVTVDWK